MRPAAIRPLLSLLPSSAVLVIALSAGAFFVPAPSAFAQGWNPADMLRRADRNGDGKLEATEVDERFKGFLERAASEAGMRNGFPYDVNQLAEAMDRRRRERERDDDDDDDRDRDRDRGRDQPSEPEPLVPGFGETTELPAPLGFGEGSVFLTREQAQKQYGSRLVSMVDSMMERYDRDKSGALEQREWEGARWSSPPESSDANKDGILTQSELYLRLKDRYSGDDDDDDGDDRSDRSDSSRVASTAARPAGIISNVPGIGTGSVAGAEAPRTNRFLPTRNDDDDDGRGDQGRYERSAPAPARPGVIVGGGPNGAVPSRFAAPNGAGGPQPQGQSNHGDRDEDEEEDEDEESNSESDANRERYMRFADTMLKQYDRNKDGVLQKDEWSKMTGDPGAADYDKDGNLTKDEMFRRLSERYGGTSGGSSASSRASAPRTSSLQTNRTGVSSKDAYAASRAYEQEGNRPAYRFLTPVERLPSGLPDWFLEKDKNADAQVGMYEYADEWSDEEAEKLAKLDKNRDGFLSASEVSGGDSQSGDGGEEDGDEDR